MPLVEEAGNVDTSLVTGQLRIPPCWQGICPGDPWIEAEEKLRSLSSIDQTQLKELSKGLEWPGGILFHDDSDQVERIGYVLEYRLEIQELVDRYGEPDGFIYDKEVEGPLILSMQLFWPNQGLSATVNTSIDIEEATKMAPIRPESLVHSVIYYVPVQDAKAYFLKFAKPSDNEKLTVLELYGYFEWEGYVPLPYY